LGTKSVEEGHSAMERDRQNRTILVVDDDHTIRMLLEAFLSNAGYTVVTAADGAEGLNCFMQHQYTVGLVLTDVMMPNMNGLDLADRVLELDPQLPVLFMSGDVRSASRGFGCLPKPFKEAELIGRVREILPSQPPRTAATSSATMA
jgi:two-component system cell cycle sensor histidine kinase/response regulator CckA